jgi:hypothetical protein
MVVSISFYTELGAADVDETGEVVFSCSEQVRPNVVTIAATKKILPLIISSSLG